MTLAPRPRSTSSRGAKPKNFLSFLFAAPPTPPAGGKKKGKENFWSLLPRPQGADEARDIQAYDLVSSHHAFRASHLLALKKPLSSVLVPGRGLEPPQDCSRQRLKLVRLPFRHPGIECSV